MTKRCLRWSVSAAVNAKSLGHTLHLTMQRQEKGIEIGTSDSSHGGAKMAGQGLYLHA